MLKKFFEGLYIHKLQKEQQYDQHTVDETAKYEDQLEAIIEMIQKIGQKFEADEKSKGQINQDEENIQKIDQYIKSNYNFKENSEKDEIFFVSLNGLFEIFALLKERNLISTRISLLYVNLSNRKNDNWQQGLNVDNQATTLDKVRNEFEIALEEQDSQQYDQEEDYKSKSHKNRNNKYNNNEQQVYYVKKTPEVKCQVKGSQPANTSPNNNNRNKVVSDEQKNKFKSQLFDDKPKKEMSDDGIKKIVKSIYESMELEGASKDCLDFEKGHADQVDTLIKFVLKELPECNKDGIDSRVDLVRNLNDKCWKMPTFIKVFNDILNKAWSEASDLPYMKTCYTYLFGHYMAEAKVSYADLSIHLKKDEDDEEIIYFFKEFIESMNKFLTTEHSVLYKTEDHIEAIKKIFNDAEFSDTENLINGLK